MTEKDLNQVYREFDAACANTVNQIRGSRDYETQGFIPSPQAMEQGEKALNVLLTQAQNLATPDPVYSLLRNHFQEFIQGQISSLNMTYKRPGLTIGAMTSFINYMISKDSRPLEERLDILTARLNKMDDTWNAIQNRMNQFSQDSLGELAAACSTLARVANMAREQRDQPILDKELLALAEKAQAWQSIAQERVSPRDSDEAVSLKLEEDYYRKLLTQELGVDLDELLSWYDSEVDKTRQEVFEIASKLNLPTQISTMEDVAKILGQHAGPCDTVEEMFERGKTYLDRAQEGCKGYVKLPDENCLILPVPEQIKGHYPWGGYGGGCPRPRPLTGEMYLNDVNYKAVTDGWLKMMAIHEAYPGHHVQFVRAITDPLPETVKMGARSIPLIEGVAHRSERVFEFVFEEDPFYPLFVAFRRHHTSVRIKAELYLRYFGKPISDAVELYMQELGFDQKTARGQVKAQELMVGYFNCYYYGMKQLLDLEKEYGYDEKEYTELLFSVGRISLDSFKAFLKLSPQDKTRFQTQFPSMLKY